MSYLQGVSPLLGEGTQVVPLVTDALAAGVDRGSIVVVELTADSKVSLEYLSHFYSTLHVEVSEDHSALEELKKKCAARIHFHSFLIE